MRGLATCNRRDEGDHVTVDEPFLAARKRLVARDTDVRFALRVGSMQRRQMLAQLSDRRDARTKLDGLFRQSHRIA
jgi:hypothetical protein